MGIRTFLALDMDDAILDGLEEVRSKVDDPRSRIRWVARENLHLTLRFLGDVPGDVVGKVCEIATDVAGQIDPFEFDVRGIACVPPRGGIRMFWVNVVDTGGTLMELHEILATRLSGMGLKEENRSFKPHITLARARFVHDPEGLRETARIYTDRDFGTQHTDELVTYSSQLTPAGPIYVPLSRAPMGR